MKPIFIITQILLFGIGSFMIVKDYQNNGPDATMLSWSGVVLILLSGFLYLIMSGLNKKR